MSSVPNILVVDDEKSLAGVLQTLLKTKGYNVITSNDGNQAKEIIMSNDIDLMISDIRMSPVNGIELLGFAKKAKPDMVVLMLTAFSSINTAIESLKLGAFDYLTKPFKVDDMLMTIERALEYRKALAAKGDKLQAPEAKYFIHNLIAESRDMQEVCMMIEKIAPTDSAVLVIGGVGVGKSAIARAIHEMSPRKTRQFLSINCATLPEPVLEAELYGFVRGSVSSPTPNKQGLLEMVHGGTLFIEEIGLMPAKIQDMFIKTIMEKSIKRVGGNDNMPVDVRIIAANNSDIKALVDAGDFRHDLYSRLSIIKMEIKPLAERIDDVLPIAVSIVHELSLGGKPLTLDPDACAVLYSYSWPGNVKEMENVLKNASKLAVDGVITKEHLPVHISSVKIKTASHTALQKLEAYKGRFLKAYLSAKVGKG